MLDDALLRTEPFSDNVEAALYYVSGYIAHKERILIADSAPDVDQPHPESEFLQNLSRGGLSHPSPSLVGFVRACYYSYEELIKHVDTPSLYCSIRFRKLFECLGESYPCDFANNLNTIVKRIVNIFFKGFIRATNESSKQGSTSSGLAQQRKLRKLNFI